MHAARMRSHSERPSSVFDSKTAARPRAETKLRRFLGKSERGFFIQIVDLGRQTHLSGLV